MTRVIIQQSHYIHYVDLLNNIRFSVHFVKSFFGYFGVSGYKLRNPDSPYKKTRIILDLTIMHCYILKRFEEVVGRIKRMEKH